MVLLAGLVGVIQVISSGTNMLDSARKQNVAARVLHSEIDKLRLYDWSNITSLQGQGSQTAAVDLTADPSGKTLSYRKDSDNSIPNAPDKLKIVEVGTPVDSSFKCNRTVTDVPGHTNGSGQNTLKNITITVTWTGKNGRTYSRSSFTYFGQNGLYLAFQRS